MNGISRLALTVVFYFSTICYSQAQSLGVENVRFSQEINSKVTVTYDLLGKPSEKYSVSLSVFIPQSRRKIPLTGSSVRGAIGGSVSPGKNLQIEWDLKNDFPNGLKGDGFRFIVDAYIQQKRSKWPWFMAGLAAVGGTALLLSGSGSGAADHSDLPAPPSLPNNN